MVQVRATLTYQKEIVYEPSNGAIFNDTERCLFQRHTHRYNRR